MLLIIQWLGIAGFVLCLGIMYATDHGIRGLRKHDADFRLLDMRFRYTAADVSDTFSKLGEAGRIAYRNFWILDFFFIPCLLIVQIAVVHRIDMNATARNGLVVLSAIRAALDIAENSILLHLIGKYPAEDRRTATTCAWITTSKFVVLYTWAIAVLALFLYSLAQK